VRATIGFEEASAELASLSGAIVVSGWRTTSERLADMLARTQAIATLVPHEAASLSVRLLIERGVPVAIATGLRTGPPGTLSMQAVVRTAFRECNMSLEEAISAATLNAAYAAGNGDHAGSIEFGKEADLLILDASDYRELAEYHGMNLAALSLKRGEVMYRRQEFACP
jgi:imidazolonepropionase